MTRPAPARYYCPVPSCGRERGKGHLMCAECWRRVPRHLRLAIWRLQDRSPGGLEHRRLCAAAVRAVDYKLTRREA